MSVTLSFPVVVESSTVSCYLFPFTGWDPYAPASPSALPAAASSSSGGSATAATTSSASDTAASIATLSSPTDEATAALAAATITSPTAANTDASSGVVAVAAVDDGDAEAARRRAAKAVYLAAVASGAIPPSSYPSKTRNAADSDAVTALGEKRQREETTDGDATTDVNTAVTVTDVDTADGAATADGAETIESVSAVAVLSPTSPTAAANAAAAKTTATTTGPFLGSGLMLHASPSGSGYASNDAQLLESAAWCFGSGTRVYISRPTAYHFAGVLPAPTADEYVISTQAYGDGAHVTFYSNAVDATTTSLIRSTNGSTSADVLARQLVRFVVNGFSSSYFIRTRLATTGGDSLYAVSTHPSPYATPLVSAIVAKDSSSAGSPLAFTVASNGGTGPVISTNLNSATGVASGAMKYRIYCPDRSPYPATSVASRFLLTGTAEYYTGLQQTSTLNATSCYFEFEQYAAPTATNPFHTYHIKMSNGKYLCMYYEEGVYFLEWRDEPDAMERFSIRPYASNDIATNGLFCIVSAYYNPPMCIELDSTGISPIGIPFSSRTVNCGFELRPAAGFETMPSGV